MTKLDDYVKEHGYIVFPSTKEYGEFTKLLMKEPLESKEDRGYKPLTYKGIVAMYCDNLFYSDGRKP